LEITKSKIREGYISAYWDISQAEPRTICYRSGDPIFRELYEEGGDAYRELARRKWLAANGYPTDMDSPGRKEIDENWVTNQRGLYKTLILSGIYGQSIANLSKTAGIPKEVGQEIWEGFMGPMKKVQEFRDENIRYATEHGYIRTILGERVRTKKNKLFTTANNAAVQGFTAVILACFFFNCVERAMDLGIDATSKMVIHDSQTIEFPINQLFKMDLICRKHFRQSCKKYFGCDYKYDWDLLLDLMKHIPYNFNKETGIATFTLWTEKVDYLLDHLSGSYDFKVTKREEFIDKDVTGMSLILKQYRNKYHSIMETENFRQNKQTNLEIQLTSELKDIEFWDEPLPETFSEYVSQLRVLDVFS